MSYEGVIEEIVDRRRTSVKFDSRELGCQTVAARYVIPHAGAISRPQLAVCSPLLRSLFYFSAPLGYLFGSWFAVGWAKLGETVSEYILHRSGPTTPYARISRRKQYIPVD